MTLQSTYLLQRLNPPHRPKSIAHRVFGGHMLGLGEKAWDLLDEHCTLAYMGAAEYEFGTLPKALGEFVERSKAGQLKSFAFTIGPHERELSPHRRDRLPAKLWPAQTVCVYGFGRESDLADMQERIRFLARGGQGTYIKAGSHLAHDLDVGRYLPDQSDTRTGGSNWTTCSCSSPTARCGRGSAGSSGSRSAMCRSFRRLPIFRVCASPRSVRWPSTSGSSARSARRACSQRRRCSNVWRGVRRETHIRNRKAAAFRRARRHVSEMDNDLELRFCARASQGRDPSECVPPNAVLIEQNTLRKPR